MTEFLDHLNILASFLKEVSERENIKETDSIKLRILHHKIAEKTLMIIKCLDVNTVEKNPKIPETMKKIDDQIITNPQARNLNDLLYLFEQLIGEFDTLMVPFFQKANIENNAN